MGHVFPDLNAAFRDGLVSVDNSLLEVEMVLPNGTIEKGVANGGVHTEIGRDVFSFIFLASSVSQCECMPKVTLAIEWVKRMNCISSFHTIFFHFKKVQTSSLPKPLTCGSLNLYKKPPVKHLGVCFGVCNHTLSWQTSSPVSLMQIFG